MMTPMASVTFCRFQCQSCIGVTQRCAEAGIPPAVSLPPGDPRSSRSPPRMAWPLAGLTTTAVALKGRCRAKDAKVLRVTADEPNDKAKVSLEEVRETPDFCRFLGCGMCDVGDMYVCVCVKNFPGGGGGGGGGGGRK